MFLRVSKYPPNVIFRNANINAQRANVTGSMIWHNNVEPPILLCRTRLRLPNAVVFSRVYLFYLFSPLSPDSDTDAESLLNDLSNSIKNGLLFMQDPISKVHTCGREGGGEGRGREG